MKYTHEFELFEIRTPNGLGNICYKAGSFCNAVLQSTGVRGRIEWILAGVANACLSMLLSFMHPRVFVMRLNCLMMHGFRIKRIDRLQNVGNVKTEL